ncbi:MAG: hypothetical protein GF309_04120 [Candidatus Lokiarchaeota archaeon]|nr:hypothetical protein [Candidatus Lokiarchaeota archaeon]
MAPVRSSYRGISRRAMRKSCLLVVLCFPSLVMGFAGTTLADHEPAQKTETTWEAIEHGYPEATFLDVEFINATHGWVLGELEEHIPTTIIVLGTEDGGDSWQLLYNKSSQYATIMDVVDEKTIWINGRGRLFYTIDGGQTWNQSSTTKLNYSMTTVGFINKTHGWTAYHWMLYETSDGGDTWESVLGWTFNDNLRMMQFLSPQVIWAMGFGGIYHSEDGGETWESTSDRGGWSVSFVSETEGWAIGDDRLAHTTDGETWEELPVPERTPFGGFRLPYCTDIHFLDKDHGWIVGDTVDVMYTPDGGANWYEQTAPEGLSQRMVAVDFNNLTHGWVVGASTILRTTTGDRLGTRLWNGLTDRLFQSIIIAAVSIIVVVGGIHAIRRRGKNPQRELSPAPEIE